MYLKSLELSGFKSFAKKTELNFATPITGIVGPNGSGKSNISEAFRFVLGEQSIKSMRGKRTEDLIWNGGGDLSRANRAGVKVVFDNHKRILNVDFDEVSIERVVYRDSSSEYLINGTQVRLKDVIELLAAAHIGSSGHHIISQGEADRILNANSRERRDMLEDALGLKIFEYKRIESERKLEKTEENIKSVESLRREIAPHLKFLKKQVEKIEKTLELKEQLRALYKEYLKREDNHLKQEKNALEGERQKPLTDLKKLEHDLANAKAFLEKSAGRDHKSDELIKLEEDLSALRQEKDTIVRELGRIEGAILSEKRIVERERLVQAREGTQTVPLGEVENFARTVEEKMKVVEAENNPQGFVGFLAFIRKAFQDFVSSHRAKSNARLTEDSEGEITRLTLERETLDGKLKNVVIREAEFRQNYTVLQSAIEKEKNSGREAERDVFRIVSEQNDIRAILAKLTQREEKLIVIEEDFKRELQEGSMLLGRAVLDFDAFVISEIAEERTAQDNRKHLIQKLKIRIEDAGTGGGEDVMKEFKEATERDAFLERELADLALSAVSLKNLIAELGEKLNQEFQAGVEKINTQFQNFFILMFGGGSAKLEVVREQKKKKADTDLDISGEEEMLSDEPDEDGEVKEGIEIEISLPRKKIKGLMMLSGGERALTSIALLFALSQVNPPPFVILDETDAALDEANSKKYGDMIESLAKLSQLILITHNRETMSRAGVIYGVTMGSGGASKLLSIAFDQAVEVAK
ncbi:MAG: AAA family ATPase [Patescibacteria group bacterium]